LIDQQQQLQLAAVAENHQLEEHVQKLSGLLKSSSSTQKQQSSDKDDTLSNNTNDNHSKQNGNKVTKYGNGQKKACKSKANNSWWHFW
jgi:hypothetical protein